MKRFLIILSGLLVLVTGCSFNHKSDEGFKHWMKYRYFEDNTVAYFMDRDFSIDSYSLYDLVWYLKTAKCINTNIDNVQVRSDLSSMNNRLYYESDIDQYGEEYVLYLCSELYYLNHDVFTDISEYQNKISELTDILLQNENEEEAATKAFLLIKSYLNFNVVKDEKFEALLRIVYSSFKASATEYLDLVKNLDCIEIMIIGDQPKDDIIQKYGAMVDKLQSLVSNIDHNTLPMLSTGILKMLWIEDKLQYGNTGESEVIQSIYEYRHTYASLDIQSKYEVYTILSYNNLKIEDPSIDTFFQYRIYLCPFWKNIRTQYYGLKVSELNSYPYNANKIRSYVSRESIESYKNISDLFYYYKVCEKLNIEIPDNVNSVFSALSNNYNQDKMSYEELYYFKELSSYLGIEYNYEVIVDTDFKEVGRLDELYYLIQLYKSYGIKVDQKEIEDICSGYFNHSEGGYNASSEYKQPSITATYFAFLIYDGLNLVNANKSAIHGFLNNMQLDDGGIKEIEAHKSGTIETYFRAAWLIEHLK